MRPVTRLINHLFIKTMYLDAAKKQEIFSKYGKSNTDTGSAESQIALFSYRIARLTEHLKLNRKDYSTERALTMCASNPLACIETKGEGPAPVPLFLCPIRNLLYFARDEFALGCLTG